jgi:hypothetical protein
MGWILSRDGMDEAAAGESVVRPGMLVLKNLAAL